MKHGAKLQNFYQSEAKRRKKYYIFMDFWGKVKVD